MSSECLFWAVKAEIGHPHRKLILIALADIANENRRCWPSHEYLCRIAECSRSSVIRQLKELESAGFITTIQRSDKNLKKTNIYTLHPTISNVSGRHIDVSDRHKGSVRETHNTLIDTPIKHICSNWQDWVAYRKQLKKPLTEKTIKLQTNFLEKFDEEMRVKIIEQSIFNGWAGLFELKGERNEVNQRSNSNHRPGTAAAAAAKLRERIKSNS